MPPTATGVNRHDPIPGGHVTIIFNDNTRLTVCHWSQFDIHAKHETDSMLPDTITDDRAEIRELINTISDDIPDDVERTARRLLQLDAWIEDTDPTTTRDSFLDVYGAYSPLRPSQNHLVLVEEANQTICDRVLPVVVSLHKPTWDRRNKAVKTHLSEILDTLTMRAVDSQTEHFFREDPVKQITATKFRTVESLEAAERIVTGDDDLCDSPGAGETTDQSSLNSF